MSGELLGQTMLSPAHWSGAPGRGEAEVRGGGPPSATASPLVPSQPILVATGLSSTKGASEVARKTHTMMTTLKTLRRLEWQVGPIGQSG